MSRRLDCFTADKDEVGDAIIHPQDGLRRFEETGFLK
jgi:hypothetical protein